MGYFWNTEVIIHQYFLNLHDWTFKELQTCVVIIFYNTGLDKVSVFYLFWGGISFSSFFVLCVFCLFWVFNSKSLFCIINKKNYWVQVSATELLGINQVTSRCQMEFLDKTSKKKSNAEKVNIIIEFCIFKIV